VHEYGEACGETKAELVVLGFSGENIVKLINLCCSHDECTESESGKLFRTTREDKGSGFCCSKKNKKDRER